MSRKDDKSEVKIYIVVVAFIALLIVIYAIAGCSPRVVEKIVEKEKVVYRDSTIWRDSLIHVPLPLEKDQAIVHVGDTSKLETSLAESSAFVGHDGLLHHSLKNKKGSLNAIVKIPSRMIWVEVAKENDHAITRTVYVEKPLTWVQKQKIGAFWWLVAGLAAALLYIFRKPLMKLIGL